VRIGRDLCERGVFLLGGDDELQRHLRQHADQPGELRHLRARVRGRPDMRGRRLRL